MPRVKILREDINEIVSVAGRLAKRMNSTFEIASERVEIIENFIPEDSQSSDETPASDSAALTVQEQSF